MKLFKNKKKIILGILKQATKFYGIWRWKENFMKENFYVKWNDENFVIYGEETISLFKKIAYLYMIIFMYLICTWLLVY